MSPSLSAGVLLYRTSPRGLELLVAHPGGPYWAKKDAGAWSIPKGLVDPGEHPEAAARREFSEETGHEAPRDLIDLGEVRLRSGKTVRAFAGEGDLEPAEVAGNTTSIEWPPRSGRRLVVPEIDRVAWVDPAEARRLLNAAQSPLVDRLEALLAHAGGEPLRADGTE